MKIKYKSILNVLRLQEKIEELNESIDKHYKKKYVVGNTKYFFEFVFYAVSALGLFFDIKFFLYSLVLMPLYFIYLKYTDYSLFNKFKLKFQSKNKLISKKQSQIIWVLFQKYGFIDNEMIRHINEFEELLNSFEKANIKHFFKYKNNTMCLNNINEVFYNVAIDYISNTPTDILIQNKNEIYAFIDKVRLEKLQEKLILLFNDKLKSYFIEENHETTNLKLKFEELKLDEDLIKIKKANNKIIKNI